MNPASPSNSVPRRLYIFSRKFVLELDDSRSAGRAPRPASKDHFPYLRRDHQILRPLGNFATGDELEDLKVAQLLPRLFPTDDLHIIRLSWACTLEQR